MGINYVILTFNHGFFFGLLDIKFAEILCLYYVLAIKVKYVCLLAASGA